MEPSPRLMGKERAVGAEAPTPKLTNHSTTTSDVVPLIFAQFSTLPLSHSVSFVCLDCSPSLRTAGLLNKWDRTEPK